MSAGKSLRILLTEDHADTLDAMARLLRRSGHTVYTARTAEQAKDLAAANACDLLVGDIGLPGRSGIELMRELRELHGLKGIAVSGYAARDDVSAALAAGFDKHVAKPVVFDELLAAIQELAR
jgi:two-component system CheB/CheR fusion protein